LSNKIVSRYGKLVCVPFDVFKLGASLVFLPGNGGGASIQNKKRMERIIGTLFNGGWSNSGFYEFLARTYKDLRKAMQEDLYPSEVPSGLERDVLEMFEALPDKDEVPSVEFFFDMNTMSKDDFVAKHLAGERKERSGKDEELLAVASEQELNVDVLDEELAGLDFNISSDPIPVFAIGNANAVTILEKDRLQAKRELLKQKKFVQTFLLENTTEKQQHGKRYAKYFEADYEMNVKDFEKDFYDDFGDDPDIRTQRDELESFFKSWDDYEEDRGIERRERNRDEDDVDESINEMMDAEYDPSDGHRVAL